MKGLLAIGPPAGWFGVEVVGSPGAHASELLSRIGRSLNALLPEEEAAGWRLLFDGERLEGDLPWQ